MGDGLPREGKKARLEVLTDLQRLEEPGVRPLTEAIMSPDNDIGSFTPLSGALKLVSEAVQWLHFDGNAELCFTLLAEGCESLPPFVSPDPYQNLAIDPGKRPR